MYGKVISACVIGIEGVLVEVETDISNGLPYFQVVGLPDSAIREAMERVRAALKNCGFSFPMERITVNLAPADVRKEGSAFDLAIAAGILAASGQLKLDQDERTLWIGELALDGSLRPVTGVLSMVHQAIRQGVRRVVLPVMNNEEAQLISEMQIRALRHLRELSEDEGARVIVGMGEITSADGSDCANAGDSTRASSGTDIVTDADVGDGVDTIMRTGTNAGVIVDRDITESTTYSGNITRTSPAGHPQDASTVGSITCDEALEDYADVCGQHQAKRALMIAAAGMHNLLFIGPPGTGKTMLVRRLPTILPEMSDEEALEVTKIYSVSGKLNDRGQLVRKRPFRSPHHTVSAGGLVGGGSIPKPGEVSLAHRGVLFLDELPEFGRNALEVLRQPLEDRTVTIGRARAVFTFPAHFMLAASMNPCPCGFYGAESSLTPCTCSPLKILQYRARISGPLLDRIDLHVEVPRTRYNELSGSGSSVQMSSADMRARVLEARNIQERRYAGSPYRYNGELNGRGLRKFCKPTPQAAELLSGTFEALGLSVRAHDRILKLARTIADLEGSEALDTPHVAEAIQYRNLDKTNKPLG